MIDRRIKAARFPAHKTLDCFNFDALPPSNKKQAPKLACCDFVARRENIIALGPSCVGTIPISIDNGLAPPSMGTERASLPPQRFSAE